MRFDTLFLAATAVAIFSFFASNEAQAQHFQGQQIQAQQFLGSSVSYAAAPGQYLPNYAPEYAPSPSTYHAQVATQTSGCHGCRGKGKVSTGQIHGGCRNCAHEAPIQTQQDYSAVPSCCGTLGQLDIPPLLTPPRLDRPRVGKAVGRPLFGQWQGY